MDHLLHCPIARELWQLLQCLFGVTWVMPNLVFATLDPGKGKLSNHRSGDIWGASPSCLMWCNWNEMNLRTSEGKELPLPHLKLLFLKMLFK